MEHQTGPVGRDKVSQMNSIFQEIQTLYDAGTPIFTKDNIRKVSEELQHFQKGERNEGGKIIIKGVNEVDYEIFVKPPSLRPPRINQVFGGSKWVICYYSIESLTTFLFWDLDLFDPQLAYLPMQICAPIRLPSNFDQSIDNKPPAPSIEDFSTYQAIEQQWKTSQHYAQLQEILTKIEISFTLTKVIALALGPLIVRSQISKTRFLQHALVSALYSTLVHCSSVSPEKYVQDPGYTQRDKDIIYSARFTILDDPQALLELDESSVLVSIAADIPVGDIVVDICRPGIIIRDDRAREDLDPPLNPRVQKMIKNEYSEISFPHYEECFGDLRMVMLIRKSTSGG